jgi:putative tryptophan/tyrosine transport system substrate-binding protein
MDRRAFVTGLGAVLAAPRAAKAQQAGRVYRIGYMSVVSRQSAEPLMVIFLRALRDFGWIEGRNLLVEWRWADGKVERLSGFATDLAKLNVDLIVAPQSDSALAAKRVTRTIPIVHVVAVSVDRLNACAGGSNVPRPDRATGGGRP